MRRAVAEGVSVLKNGEMAGVLGGDYKDKMADRLLNMVHGGVEQVAGVV